MYNFFFEIRGGIGFTIDSFRCVFVGALVGCVKGTRPRAYGVSGVSCKVEPSPRLRNMQVHIIVGSVGLDQNRK